MKKKYLLTNNCYWFEKDHTKRVPHYIEVVDLKTGEVKHVKNGARIEIISGEIIDAE